MNKLVKRIEFEDGTCTYDFSNECVGEFIGNHEKGVNALFERVYELESDKRMENVNKCAMNNVIDHLFVEMCRWKDAERQAILEGKIEKCIEMYHDMSYIYEKLLAELDNKILVLGGDDMNNNEYVLECTSISNSERIIDKYPILKNYKARIDYPYPSGERARLIIKVDDLIKFYDDIGEEIIIGKEILLDDEMYMLEIYDSYRE